jgi:hypothetical protein
MAFLTISAFGERVKPEAFVRKYLRRVRRCAHCRDPRALASALLHKCSIRRWRSTASRPSERDISAVPLRGFRARALASDWEPIVGVEGGDYGDAQDGRCGAEGGAEREPGERGLEGSADRCRARRAFPSDPDPRLPRRRSVPRPAGGRYPPGVRGRIRQLSTRRVGGSRSGTSRPRCALSERGRGPGSSPSGIRCHGRSSSSCGRWSRSPRRTR